MYKNIVLNPSDVMKSVGVTNAGSDKYSRQKEIILDKFFSIVKEVEDIKSLADDVPVNPEIPSIKIKRF